MNLKMLAFRALAVSSLLLGCGKLVDMGGGSATGQQERIFVNDAAPAESLPSVIISGGVYFTMQPGKAYQLRVRSPIAGQQLQVLRARGDQYYSWQTFTPESSGDSVQIFTLTPAQGDTTRYYRAFLQSASGLPGTRPQKVRLVPNVAAAANTLRVKVVLVRTLNNVPDAQKEAFAQALLNGLASIYGAFNITVTGTYEIAEPTGPRVVPTFGGGLDDFSAVRHADTAYVYVVDNVVYKGKENTELLGYAPREGFTLREDYVVLNAAGLPANSTAAAKGAAASVTAAHELGHLFGLRHTRPSGADLDNEYDKSNTHDGFDPPEACAALPKRSGASQDRADGYSEIKVGDRVFCMRTAADVNIYCNCSDQTNLMYAYGCSGVVQKSMNGGQQNLLRLNISLYR